MSMFPQLSTPRYFDGQRLTAADLNDAFTGERERRWFHNRALHGTGISSGLTVTGRQGDATVEVEPGHAIDSLGRDLILTRPVTVQVPAKRGTVVNSNVVPDVFALVCRWNDTDMATVGSGPCLATGEVAWSEVPVIEVLREADVTADAVLLARLEVVNCALYRIDPGRRQTLAPERQCPIVNGGTEPHPRWQLLTVPVEDGGNLEAAPTTRDVPIGVEVEIDTTVAGFRSTPDYQVRVTGKRWFTTTVDGESDTVVLWTADPVLVAQTPTSLTLQMLILVAQSLSGFPTESLDSLLAFLSMTTDQFLTDIVGDDLQWGVTWIGVAGSL